MGIKIVADTNIPFMEDVFSEFGDVHLLPGPEIAPNEVKNADVLVVRSVNRIDARLLEDSSVRFVASATAGIDHVDLGFLKEKGIGFAHAPGANAESVVEYVLAALYELATRHSSLESRTLGIVGCGAIGSRLARRAAALGLRVLRNDPPLARLAERRGESHDYVELSSLLRESDILTLHVPLTRDGRDPTFHLIGDRELSLLPSTAWFINTSRGGVADERSLRRAIVNGRLVGAVVDVWETEPSPDPELHHLAEIATAHIAGYSHEAKMASTEAVAVAVCQFFGLERRPGSGDPSGAVLELQMPDADFRVDPDLFMHELARQMYPIVEDHERMAPLRTVSEPERRHAFRSLRVDYPVRHTFRRFSLHGRELPSMLKNRLGVGLGIAIS